MDRNREHRAAERDEIEVGQSGQTRESSSKSPRNSGSLGSVKTAVSGSVPRRHAHSPRKHCRRAAKANSAHSNSESKKSTLSLFHVATQAAIEKHLTQELLLEEHQGWSANNGKATDTKILTALTRKLSDASANLRRQMYYDDGNEQEDDYDNDNDETLCDCIMSVRSQLEELSHEVNSTMEFLGKAYKIMMRTSAATICLAIAITVPTLMTYVGLKYLEDCPIEPHIPIYLLVGGGFGIVNILYLIWRHSVKRYSENNDPRAEEAGDISKSYKLLDILNLIFAVAWFACGNYWVFSVYTTVRMESSYHRRTWCHKNVYWFSVAQVLLGNCFVIFVSLFLFSLILFYRTHRFRYVY